MFRGWYYHTIDDKGRLSIPTRFREVLNGRAEDHLVLTNLDRCLVAFPLSDWRVFEEKCSNFRPFDSDSRAFLRFFFSGAIECSIDKQGRILVPPSLRKFAELDKDVVIVGMLKSIEVWNKQNFEQEIEQYSTGEKTINAREEMIKLGM
jgi:MraZ protein